MPMEWFVVNTYSGFEQKVKDHLAKRVDEAGLNEHVSQVLIPTEEVAEIREGKKKITQRKFFPGYILVQMDMTDELWHVIRNTPRVTGFLGGDRPVALAETEVETIFEQIGKAKSRPRPKTQFEEGEPVKITSGPFVNFQGVIEEVNPQRGKVRITVSIFGRQTPLEVDFEQIEKT
ncbi:MAG: transcription termination/antitermination protein NusG [Candidatus Coatesbacteria bacterium]